MSFQAFADVGQKRDRSVEANILSGRLFRDWNNVGKLPLSWQLPTVD